MRFALDRTLADGFVCASCREPIPANVLYAEVHDDGSPWFSPCATWCLKCADRELADEGESLVRISALAREVV